MEKMSTAFGGVHGMDKFKTRVNRVLNGVHKHSNPKKEPR